MEQFAIAAGNSNKDVDSVSPAASGQEQTFTQFLQLIRNIKWHHSQTGMMIPMVVLLMM